MLNSPICFKNAPITQTSLSPRIYFVFGAAENGPHFLAYTLNEMIGWNSVLANMSSQKYA